jgi:hypothetical protein
MICYRDRAFCSRTDDCKCDDFRRMTPDKLADARKWWGSDDPPIAWMDLCGGNPAAPKERDDE